MGIEYVADSMDEEDVKCREFAERALDTPFTGLAAGERMLAALFKEARAKAIDEHEFDMDDEALDPVREAAHTEGYETGTEDTKDKLRRAIDKLKGEL